MNPPTNPPAPRFDRLTRTFIVAEIGVNHEGDAEVARELVRQAAACGVDAVKFQTYDVQHYVSREQPERFERAGQFQLSMQQFRDLAETARECGVLFFSTPLGLDDVRGLADFAPILKISSGDLTCLDLIAAAASLHRPLIISTGLGSESEIADAVATVERAWPGVREAGGLALMHCVAAYPTAPEDANLRNIRWLAEAFGYPVGYSDHTLGIRACELAVAAGASLIEKHFTYRKEDQAFHDHRLSADPRDLGELVERIRSAEVYLGSRERRTCAAEEALRAHMRRSIGTLRALEAGATIERADLTWLRPQWGLPPDAMERTLGRRLARGVPAGHLLREDDLLPESEA